MQTTTDSVVPDEVYLAMYPEDDDGRQLIWDVERWQIEQLPYEREVLSELQVLNRTTEQLIACRAKRNMLIQENQKLRQRIQREEEKYGGRA